MVYMGHAKMNSANNIDNEILLLAENISQAKIARKR